MVNGGTHAGTRPEDKRVTSKARRNEQKVLINEQKDEIRQIEHNIQ